MTLSVADWARASEDWAALSLELAQLALPAFREVLDDDR